MSPLRVAAELRRWSTLHAAEGAVEGSFRSVAWLSYDTKGKEFNSFTLPKLKFGSASGNTMRVHPDGSVWLCSLEANQIIRLDPKTKEFKVWDVPAGVAAGKSANPYGMAISGDGKVWFVENALSQIGRIDPATGKFDDFKIPVANAVARKMGMDSAALRAFSDKRSGWKALRRRSRLLRAASPRRLL